MIYFNENAKNVSFFDTSTIENSKLSFKARGVLLYLLSKPNNYVVKIADIVKSSDKDGLEAIKSAMKELVNEGYAVLVKGSHQCSDGKKLIGSHYFIFENPNDNSKPNK